MRMTGIAKAEAIRLALGIGVLGVTVTGLTAVGTGAVFSDSKDIGANTFATGSVHLSTNPTTAALTLSSMAPGDSVARVITVSNTGTLQHRYAVVSTTTGDQPLAQALVLTIKSGVTTCTTGGFSASGTELYRGWLGTSAGIKVIGDSTQGAQAGDRTLAADASEDLCAMVQLPLTTGNAVQSMTTTATLTFNAEQVANN